MLSDRRLDFGSSHWRDFSGVNRDDLEAIAREYNLSADMVQDCLDPDHLPKIQRTGSVTFLMLRAFDEKSSETATDVQEATRKVAIFWGENFLLTIHRAPLFWLDSIWQDWDRKATRASLAPLVEDIVEESLYTYDAPIDRAYTAIDKLEDAIFHDISQATAPSHILETAYLAKKRATLFKRMLRLTRDFLPSLSKLGDANSATIQNLKEESDRLYFYSDDLVETANDLVQLSISLTTNRTNNVVRVLTIVSIFLMPLNLLVGVYGMNFEFMPELKWEYGYAYVLVLMVLIELGIFWLLKRRGWIRNRRR